MLIKELYYLVKEGFSYNDLLKMPIHIRKSFLNYIFSIREEVNNEENGWTDRKDFTKLLN